MVSATASAASTAAKKKTAGAKKTKSASSHPPFIDVFSPSRNMISYAILSLKERTGSSQYAISKFIEEKYKQLPPNFRKLLLVQLKKFVASGKLVKVKASYKLLPASFAPKKPATMKPKDASSATVNPRPKDASSATVKSKRKDASSATVKPKPKVVKAAVKPKPKTKVATPVKAKVKAVSKPTKAAKTRKPAKKVKAPAKKAVVAKKPKSVKSPAKKAAKK